jgi:hypothetical protein
VTALREGIVNGSKFLDLLSSMDFASSTRLVMDSIAFDISSIA